MWLTLTSSADKKEVTINFDNVAYFRATKEGKTNIAFSSPADQKLITAVLETPLHIQHLLSEGKTNLPVTGLDLAPLK
jgi:hypothetical protein